MTRVCSTLIACSLVIAGSLVADTATGAVLLLQESNKTGKKITTVAGKWNISVKSPHGPTPMTLTLEQNGKKVTGMFNPHGDDIPVNGEFSDGTLTLATAEASDSRISFKARLKDNGTLEGFVSSEMGDMTWTAERAPAKDVKEAKDVQTGTKDR